jgi:hypothetical protein
VNRTIRYRVEPHQLTVVWNNIADFDMSSWNSFMVILKESGSVIFCYKRFSLTQISSGFVGIRPFYRFPEYSTRGVYISSNTEDWSLRRGPLTPRKTTQYGNYISLDHLRSIHNQTTPGGDYLFRDVAYFLLAPSELCVTPSVLSQRSPQNLTVSFSWLDPSFPEEYLRCDLGRNISAPVQWLLLPSVTPRRLSASQLLCRMPDLSDLPISSSLLLIVTIA